MTIDATPSIAPWGDGDLIALGIGVVYLAIGLWLLPERRTVDGARDMLGAGISLGPLLMIMLDPVNQYFWHHQAELLNLVVNQGRATLWWAATIAAINLLSLITPRRQALGARKS